MPQTYFNGETIDDLMRDVLIEIKAHGAAIVPSKGPAREITGVLLELTNPRARLSRTETRGKPYSCLGELFWYLSGTQWLDFIFYYIPKYKNYAEGKEKNEIYGGYGPRFFDWQGISQVQNIIALLRRKPFSRQAVIQIFDRTEILDEHEDVPCTCSMQFMVRDKKLHMLANMRSNDAFMGLPHDFFCFTMLQEIIARSLSVEVGTYKHSVGSLHLYDENAIAAEEFLDEGLQPTNALMPAMPVGDPWDSLVHARELEAAIRTSDLVDERVLNSMDGYWADLLRLLQVFACKKQNDAAGIVAIRNKIVAKVYLPFVDKVINQLKQEA
jgi:thymidylate synthase